ncbi:MAG TPA: hypothetical protein VLE89_00360, partial [Chlamydiales bacterium]|nr:hypothetical protein [Chlamydiales bacterium]
CEATNGSLSNESVKNSIDSLPTAKAQKVCWNKYCALPKGSYGIEYLPINAIRFFLILLHVRNIGTFFLQMQGVFPTDL